MFQVSCSMLSKDEVKNIAALARVGVNEKEIEKYQKDLSAILDYFQKLDELDTDNVSPISHITGMENKIRSDKMVDFGKLGKDSILKNAPEVKEGHIKVKSVL
jgi:aspartyl-tRNA(Asn)/glutamyl-tRNA(Gln) amidotransferase subunit C